MRYEVMNKLFKLQSGHLFKDAVPCAERVFSNTTPTNEKGYHGMLKPHEKLFYLE
jgi:hypothetical protein